MSEGSKPIVSGRRGGEGLVLGAIAVAAYVGFGAVMMLKDGPTPVAHAGVPVDAVRAVTAAAATDQASAASASAPAPTSVPSARPPAVGVGEVIPDPNRNTAEAVANPVGVRSRSVGGAAIQQFSDGVVGAADGAGGVTLQFQVKFEDEEAARWRERFLADPDGARREWAQFARSNAAFAGLTLQLPPNGSGVATLELDGGAPAAPAAQQELSDDIVRRLNAADGVEYAEPNLVGVREDAPR